MNKPHLVILTEEYSMETFLRTLLPRLLPTETTFEIHTFRGKKDLLRKLKNRLLAYVKWIPDYYRILVVIDRDNDDCRTLKSRLEELATESGLHTRSTAGFRSWQLVNRIVVEELEAWYFGDWEAVCEAYPRVSTNIPNRSRFRNPDSIAGGTWEAFEMIMQRSGYFSEGLGKVQAAESIAQHMEPNRNRSKSFNTFRFAILEATT